MNTLKHTFLMKILLNVFILFLSVSHIIGDTSYVLTITTEPPGAWVRVYKDGVEITFGGSPTPISYDRFESGDYTLQIMLAGHITQLIPISIEDINTEIHIILEKNMDDIWHHVAERDSLIEFIGFHEDDGMYGIVFHADSTSGQSDVLLFNALTVPSGTYIYFPESRDLRPFDTTLGIPDDIINRFDIRTSDELATPVASLCGQYMIAYRLESNDMWLIDIETEDMRTFSEYDTPPHEMSFEISQIVWAEDCSTFAFREVRAIGMEYYPHTLIVVTIHETINNIEKIDVLAQLQENHLAYADAIGTYLISATSLLDRFLITVRYPHNHFTTDVFDIGTNQIHRMPLRTVFNATWIHHDRLVGVGSLDSTFLFNVRIPEFIIDTFDLDTVLVGTSSNIFISPDAQYLAFYVHNSLDGSLQTFLIYSLRDWLQD
jgi:hypothetical protein